MTNIFTKLEHRLQDLIEGSATRWLSAYDSSADIAHNLVVAMQVSIRSGENGESIAPNLYILHVTPEQAAAIRSHPSILVEIARYLQQAGVDAGLSFRSAPVIKYIEQADREHGYPLITAEHSQEEISETLDFPIEDPQGEFESPANAFLIVDGVQIFSLSERLINIGRRADNHLVLDDKRVSRKHAQLRVIDGRYVIFDLDSKGGTFLNGERIQKSVLRPGDVISLSGVPLVYGQDAVEPGDTQQYRIS